MNLPEYVEIVEVGPRDGIQNERGLIPTQWKLELIAALNETGIRRMEAASFVSPKFVPQMADADEVFRNMDKRGHMQYMALIPNRRGYELARSAGVASVALVIAASDAFNRKNVRMSRQDSLVQAGQMTGQAKAFGHYVRCHISTAFWCPYQGKVEAEQVIRLVRSLLQLEVDEIVLCDTIGRANPAQVYALFGHVLDLASRTKVTAHFHDTYGMAQANAVAALHAGVRSFDASIGGLGGCPFAPGAAGNCATEDLVFMLHEMGIRTDVCWDKLLPCVEIIRKMTKRSLPGRLSHIGQPCEPG